MIVAHASMAVATTLALFAAVPTVAVATTSAPLGSETTFDAVVYDATSGGVMAVGSFIKSDSDSPTASHIGPLLPQPSSRASPNRVCSLHAIVLNSSAIREP
jgi:predicted dinucleotide-binding enzyme